MRDIFAGDIKAAADLTDPRTLERLRQSFLAELVTVTDPDAEKAILSDLGLATSTAEVSKVDAKTLYVAKTESDRRRNAERFETMKRAHVEVVGSAPNPAGGVTVRLRIITPAGSGTSSQEAALLMRQVLGDWKVVGNAPP